MALGEPGKQKLFPFRSGGPQSWKQGMMEQFPDEEKAIDKYLKLLKVNSQLNKSRHCLKMDVIQRYYTRSSHRNKLIN